MESFAPPDPGAEGEGPYANNRHLKQLRFGHFLVGLAALKPPYESSARPTQPWHRR